MRFVVPFLSLALLVTALAPFAAAEDRAFQQTRTLLQGVEDECRTVTLPTISPPGTEESPAGTVWLVLVEICRDGTVHLVGSCDSAESAWVQVWRGLPTGDLP